MDPRDEDFEICLTVVCNEATALAAWYKGLASHGQQGSRLAGVHTESLDPNNVLISFASPRPEIFFR